MALLVGGTSRSVSEGTVAHGSRLSATPEPFGPAELPSATIRRLVGGKGARMQHVGIVRRPGPPTRGADTSWSLRYIHEGMRSILRNGMLIVTLAAASSAFGHEHMYVGSDQPHGGTLVVRYDFARKFPVVPLPGTGSYLGTDPAFNAQVTDDPADGIYKLRNRTRVKMEITAIDPGVSVNFNGVKMTKPGDKAKVGRMPYLHQHPQWTLNVPPGVSGDYHLAFRVTAPGYHPSSSYVATITNVVEATTTTTTLPGTGCTPGECEDHDACTIDSCVAGACQHDPATGVDAVRCHLAKLTDGLDDLRPTTAKGRRVVARMFAVVNAIEPALQAFAAGGADAPRRLKRAERVLNHFATIVDRGVAGNAITPDSGDLLRTLAGDTYDQLVLLAP